MRTTKYLTLAAALLLLVGCAKDPAFPDAGGITVEASIGAMTKVATDGAASSFEAGDKIAVYAWTGSAAAVPAERIVDGVVNSLGSDGKWTPASQMLWKPGSDAHYFLGVSPVRTISDFTADAVTLSGTYASDDLLIAQKFDGVKPGSGAVALSFQHVMARLTVNVKVRNEFSASATVHVAVTAKSGATVNYLAGTVSATGDASALSLTAAASAPTGYTHSFSGIQVPQDGVKTIVVTVDGIAYTYTAGEDIPLTSGHHTTLGLLVGKDKIELSGVSVSDWTAGSAISGEDASVTKINGHEFVDMGNGLLWATCNVGADNPWDYGDHFAWGETTKKSTYNWSTYKFNPSGDGSTFTKYTTLGSTLEASDDAASANWGADWRTPTGAEWTWLRENSTWAWQTDYHGKKGILVTSKFNGNTIFLPAAGYRYNGQLDNVGSVGYYWSSSLGGAFSDSATLCLFASDGFYGFGVDRLNGLSIRPVAGKAPMLGDLYYSDGTYNSSLVAGKTPIGVIAYVDQPGTDDDEITEKSHGGGHGLVLCLKNAASAVKWSTETGAYEFGEGAKVDNLDALKRTTNVSGYTNTMSLVAKDDAETKYPAAWQARNYTGLAAPATGTTGWFLPSAQQWVKMLEGLGGLSEASIKWFDWFDNDHSAATAWETAMAKAGAKGTAYDSVIDAYLYYRSSSECSSVYTVGLVIDAKATGAWSGFCWGNDVKATSFADIRVRPVLAF